MNKISVPVGLVGLVGIIVYNLYKWRGDQQFLEKVREPQPLPALADWPALPTISVLVAAWNEADFIERHINSFLSLRYPHKELVLIAGGTDDTFAIAKRYAGAQITVLEQLPGQGKQRALALGFPETRGEIIFLTDADCLLDDEAFERTVYPIVCGDEQVTTGGSRPLDEQLASPFVFSQAATQVYSSLHQPDYAPGLLGRNCAIVRDLLQASHALDAEARSGTDYVTAKELVAAGARIRQLSESRMPTRFPVDVKHYLRQQRRWLRNVVIQGKRYGAQLEIKASLRTSLLGLAMLVMPVIGVGLPWLLVLWGLFIAHGTFSRVRYLGVTQQVLGCTPGWLAVLMQPALMVIDFVAWTLPLTEYLKPTNRVTW